MQFDSYFEIHEMIQIIIQATRGITVAFQTECRFSIYRKLIMFANFKSDTVSVKHAIPLMYT